MKSKKGFTLVEVITVIVILSILLVLLLPSITKVAYNSKISLDNSKRTSIEVAAEKYGNADINEFQKCTGTVSWNDTYCSINIEALYENGYLEDEDSLINPITNKTYDGRVVFCYNNENINIEAKYLTEGQSFTCGGDLIGDGDLTPIDPVEKNVTVFLEPNGGTLLGITPINRKTGQIYGDLGVATKEGYTFDGWYTASTGGTKIVPNTLVTNKENHTLYAHYSTNKYTVTYDANGGSCDVTSQNYSYNESLKAIPTPTRSGYTFDGWYTEASGGTKVTTPYTVTSNITLYAHWTKEIVYYTLTFKDGSTTVSTPITEPSGTLVPSSRFPTLTKSNYTFDGWYTASSGGTKVTSITLNSNTTLYARWTSNLKGVMMARIDNTKIWSHASNIKKIVFETTIRSKSNASYSYDISAANDGTVMAYLVPDSSDNTKFIVYIQANGKIIANSNSGSLFYSFTSLETIDNIVNFDTSNVTSMASMFNSCSSLKSLDLSNFDTSMVTNMYRMFAWCSALSSLNVSNFNTSNVTNMNSMFYSCEVLTSLNVSNFNTSKVTNMNSMFYGCKNLTSLNVSNFNTSNVTNMYGMFCNCRAITSLNLSNFDTSKVTDMAYMFWCCWNLSNIIFGNNFNTSNVTNMHGMFYECYVLTSLDLRSFNTSNVTDMFGMFEDCTNVTSLTLGSNFNTGNVTNMQEMFFCCYKLTSLNVSGFNTSKVTNMKYMFGNCRALTSLNVNNFNTSNVTNMNSMFKGCSSLTSLNLSNFNTSNVTDMSYMFSYCSNLKNLNIRNFSTSKVTSKDYIVASVPSTINITVRTSTLRTWLINASSSPKLTTSNFTVG